MKKHVGIMAYILLLGACSSPEPEKGDWTFGLKDASHSFLFYYKGNLLMDDVYPRVKVGEQFVTPKDFTDVNVTPYDVDDAVGKGDGYKVTFSGGPADTLRMEVNIAFYYDCEYFLSEVAVESLTGREISGNYMAPIYTETPFAFLPADSTNRVLRVPFDNDGFIRYQSLPLDRKVLSFEATAIYSGKERTGLVIGSVEHDTWKTGVAVSASKGTEIDTLECFGGVTDVLTRDIGNREDRPSKEHGAVKGIRIKSPRIMVGIFDDWRRGMETFGEVNARIAPPRAWKSGTPFGWNSWAALATNVNFDNSTAVSDFIKQKLQPAGFENDGVTYIGLDSFWDNMSEEQLAAFVEHCRRNGQKAGIYWCPFSDWFGDGERFVEGCDEKWRYKDIYLYANGKPRKIESLAVDPTHPATKQRMKYYIDKFKKWGFVYIKLDFINNGTLEADSFYNPDVTTGVQAYNEGMQYLCDLCGDDMFLALSIAPVFPAQYGTSRRISCDTWGAMSGIDFGTTEYMLNSLTYGWWLDRVYPFNDADHILLYKPEEAAAYTDGANRARITSAVITGLYMLGDNFSLGEGVENGPCQRALKYATNPDINEIARMHRSFYPVRGYVTDDRADNFYMMETDDYVYVAVFNFDPDEPINGKLTAEELNEEVFSGKASGKELWTGEDIICEDGLSYSVPPCDVRVFRVNK